MSGTTTRFCTWIPIGQTSFSWIGRSSPPSILGWLYYKISCPIMSSNYQQHRQGACLAAAHFGKWWAHQIPDLCLGQDDRRSDWWAMKNQSFNSGFDPAISCSRTLILAAGWLRLKSEELGSRYRMPSRAEIAKMGGDDDREDKERVMAGFLSGSENVR